MKQGELLELVDDIKSSNSTKEYDILGGEFVSPEECLILRKKQ